MLSFDRRSEEDIEVAHGYDNSGCLGKPSFTIYFIAEWNSPPAIDSGDPKSVISGERFRIKSEFGLNNVEFNSILDIVAKNEPIAIDASRTFKKAYLEITRVLHEKLKKVVEFEPTEKIFLKPIYNTMANRTNQICTLFASSGAGKSWMVNDLLMRNEAVQNNTVPAIFLFSSVGESDPSYKPIKKFYDLKFFCKNPSELDQHDLSINAYEEKSILIFDDVNSIADKLIRKRIIHFRNVCLEIARHRSLVIVSTEHLMHNRTATQKLRNSSAYLVLYPRNSPKPIDSVFDDVFNLRTQERTDLIKKISRQGRGQFVRTDYPSYLVNTKRVQLFS